MHVPLPTPLLLSGSRRHPLISAIAQALVTSVTYPTTSYHWIHHNHPRPLLPSTRRRRSLSDLDVQA